MRYSEVVSTLQTLTNEEVKPYDMVKALGGNISKYTYRRDNNGNFTSNEVNLLTEYVKSKYTVSNLDQISTNDEILLDYYEDVEASCGNGLLVASESKQKISVAREVITNYSQSKNYSVIRAVSDSMQPEIKPKDFLVVEHNESIKDNHIYIFSYQDKLYCKYLSCNLGQIIVRSANELYPIRYIDNAEEFRVIGEVVGIMRSY